MKKSSYNINDDILTEWANKTGGLVKLAQAIGISPNRLQKTREGHPLNQDDARKVHEYIGGKFTDLFSETGEMLRLGEEDYEVSSELILLGLTNNIRERLLNTHSKPFVDEIVKVVNGIIIEASYYGLQAQMYGKTDHIVKSIQRRRK